MEGEVLPIYRVVIYDNTSERICAYTIDEPCVSEHGDEIVENIMLNDSTIHVYTNYEVRTYQGFAYEAIYKKKV